MAKPIATVVTDEQYAFIKAKADAIDQDMADYLRWVLEDHYSLVGELYPKGIVARHGGARPGAGWPKGKPRKKVKKLTKRS